MSKQSKNSSNIINANFSENWGDNPVIEWVSSNRQILIGGVVALFAGLILAYRFLSVSTLNTEGDYFRAQNLFNQIQEDPAEKQADLNELETIMLRHPELQAKFDGPLAQTLLIEGNLPKAQVFADMTFSRTRAEHLKFYQDYSQTSLEIGKGNYQQALAQAQQLKNHLETQQADLHDSALYAFNLVRLALLNQQLGSKEGELQAWNAIEKLSDKSKAALGTSELFTTGSATLSQYIAERKKSDLRNK